MDDLYYRVNYNNFKIIDVGDILRFYIKIKFLLDGYRVEVRIVFFKKLINGIIMGFEFQVNEVDLSVRRVVIINMFDNIGNVW